MSGVSAPKRKGDEGVSAAAGLCADFAFECGFEFLDLNFDARSSDFLFRGSLKAEFANAHRVSAPRHSGTEGAAGEGPVCVEVASLSERVERRTRLVFGEFVEALVGLRTLLESSSSQVAREAIGVSADKRLGSGLDGGCPGGIGSGEFREPLAKAAGISLRDGERANTAVGAAGPAGEPGTGFADRFRHGGVDDLHKLIHSLMVAGFARLSLTERIQNVSFWERVGSIRLMQ